MDGSKRKFLKQGAATLGGAVMARLGGDLPAAAAAHDDDAATNWAGNLTYQTRERHHPRSVDEVRALVGSRDRLKALGTRHCFNGIADSRHAHLSLRGMSGVTEADREAGTVTVEAGASYGQLCPELHARGLALHNLASLPHISVAGACATATHGSGDGNGNLATAVSGLEIVTAAGDVLQLSRARDGETFQGAVVHLGALGVVTKVTLDTQPAFQMRQDVYLDLPMAAVEEHFEEIVSSGYSVSLFTDWRDRNVAEVWVKRRVEPGVELETAAQIHGATLATRDVHPIVDLSAEHCTEQRGVVGPWYERLPHFRMGFTPSSGEELQSEYFVPRRSAVEAILAVEALGEQVSPHLLISELRTIAADDLWMSTCYGRDSLAIHFTWKPDWEAVRRLLPLIERELGPFGVRPHWGKLFTLAPAELQARYERLDAFKQLAARLDPQGKFRNEFLATNLYG
jgi:xylitol oxidase